MHRICLWFISALLVSVFISAPTLFADEVEVPQDSKIDSSQPTMEPAAPSPGPRKHLVKEGDTLWSISNSYLIDPFYWPKVWDANQYIKNPDLIYPGNVIILPPPGALMGPPILTSIPPQAAPQAAPQVAMAPPPQKKIMEVLREEPVLDPALLASVGYVLSEDVGKSGLLVAAQDNKYLLGERDIVYIRPGGKIAPEVGEELVIYRNIRKIYHPKTRKYLGDLIVILGTVEILNADRKLMTARILKSYNYILTGDPVAPYDAVYLPNYERIPTDGDADVQGYVVDVKEEKVSIGQFDVVYIDKGLVDGIGRGSSFRVIREGERTPVHSIARGIVLPPRTIGELEVITVGNHTATAMVRKSSEPINRGDRIETLSAQ